LGQAKRLELLQNQTSAIKRPIIESQGKVLALGFDESDLSKVLLEKPPAS
jgi:arsenate reductase-like glutaredoxin family protein